jgi:Ca2+-binding EF-hand superfamily protein
MLPSLFKQADEDRSGSLDQEEVRALINTLGFTDVPDRYIAGIWGVFDVDGDGVLDLEEVKEMVEVCLCRFCTGSARADIDIDIDTDTDIAVAQRYGYRYRYRYRYEFNPCRDS